MDGIVVRRAHATRRARTDFVECFGMLYPQLAGYGWLIENAMFAVPPEWHQWYDAATDRHRGPEMDEYFSYEVALGKRGGSELWLARPGFVPRYAQYLHDDWCQLAGVAGWESDPAGLLDAAEREQVALWHLPGVEVWFQNVDAAFWQLGSTRAELIEQVVEQLRDRPDFQVERGLVRV